MSRASGSSYQPPGRWLRISKYLFPIGIKANEWRRTRAATELVPIARLAVDYPQRVQLHEAGSAETLAEFEFDCLTCGARETRLLAATTIPPAFVAEIKDGWSYGRHCCVIGPDRKAVRETGFNIDGQIRNNGIAIRRYQPRYWRKRWQGDATAAPWLPPRQHIEGSVAVLNARLSHNYYHWLIEILPRLALLAATGVRADYYLVESLSPFQQQVLESLGIQRRQMIQPHWRMLLEAKRLWVPSIPTPECLRNFRGMITAALEIDGPIRPKRRIFITRRNTGTRTLTNEVELEKLLRSQNFETHSMEQYPLAKQARLIRESDIVVATHGAGLANLLFARPGTQVIEIVPAGRNNFTCYPQKSRIFGLSHQILFAQRARHRQTMTVSLDDMADAIAQAKRHVSHRAAA